MTQTKHSPEPWSYEYNPYTGQDGSEIPAFQVIDADGNKVFDTNENTPAEMQEANACLGGAAPELLDALTYFFNIMHDHQSSVEKGYVQQAMKQAKVAIDRATGRTA